VQVRLSLSSKLFEFQIAFLFKRYRQRSEVDDIVVKVGALIQLWEARRVSDIGGNHSGGRGRNSQGDDRGRSNNRVPATGRMSWRSMLNPDTSSARRLHFRQSAQSTLSTKENKKYVKVISHLPYVFAVVSARVEHDGTKVENRTHGLLQDA